MIRRFYSQFFVILVFGLRQTSGEDCILSETKNMKYGCYGTHSGNVFMDATCPSNHKMAVCSIYAGAKKLSTGCDRATDGFNFTFQEEEKCCKPDSLEDCIFKFQVDGGFNENYKYHINCTGKTKCDQVRVVSMDSPSFCSDVHWDTSNYLNMNYFCIPESRICRITSCTLESSSTSSSLYIWNANYPSSSSAVDTASCSVEAGCGSTITITVIDIRLAQNSSNNCQQSVTFIDNTTTHRLDCSDSNNFEIKQVLQSTTNYVTMKFTNNYNSNGGYFWFGFSTFGSGCGNLKVNCPAIGPIISCDEDTSTESLCETTTFTTTEGSTITPSSTSTTEGSTATGTTTEGTTVPSPTTSTTMITTEESTVTSTTTLTPSLKTTVVETSTTKTATTEGQSESTATSTSAGTTTSPEIDTSINVFETTSDGVSTKSSELSTSANIKSTTDNNGTSSVATSSEVNTTTLLPVNQGDIFPWWIIVVAVLIILFAILTVVLYICWKKNKNKISPSERASGKIEAQANPKDQDTETISSATDANTTDQNIHNTNEDPLGSLLKMRRRSSVHYNPSLPYLDAIVDANILKATRKLAPIDLTPLANTENKKRKKKKKKKQQTIENNDVNNLLLATAGYDVNIGAEQFTK